MAIKNDEKGGDLVMNLEEAFDMIDGCVLTEKDCIFLLKVIIANLEVEE